MQTTTVPATALPLVVQVGFSGSRSLYDESVPTSLQSALDECVVRELRNVLCSLPRRLPLTAGHFLCGISQIAIGADMLFAAACSAEGVCHRFFLPQRLDDFLAAQGSRGPDFTADQQAEVRRQVAAANVIQERVVTDSIDRGERFEETNLEILRVSDLLICLTRNDAVGQRGGTQRLLEHAVQRGVPTLELRVKTEGANVALTPQEHHFDRFTLPVPPSEMAAMPVPTELSAQGLPSLEQYCSLLKSFGSDRARRLRRYFQWGAAIIIVTHVAATMLATACLATHGEHARGHLWLVVAELAALAAGLGVHEYLHRGHTGKNWALSRLVAEVCRSAAAMQHCPVYLEYLFRLPLPDRLRKVVRTVNVLHLRSSRLAGAPSLQSVQPTYLQLRVGRQIEFYAREARRAANWRNIARWVFTLCSAGAVLVVLLELFNSDVAPALLAGLSIVLPVIAVAALSLAAAADLDARAESFREMHTFLLRQQPLLEGAMSLHEFLPLMLETEERLLGETANWYSRRAYLGVT